MEILQRMPAIRGGQTPDWAGRSPQIGIVSGEVFWRWLAVAYAAYWMVFVAGALTNQPVLNNVGAVFILATIGWAALERLWVEVDAVVIACLAAALIPLLVVSVSGAAAYPDAIAKHVSLYVVMALGRMLRLPLASDSRMRNIFVVQILMVLILSLLMDRGGVYDGGTRHSGLFANPNNLALIPFLLLFFVNRRRDSAAMLVAAQAVVVGVLILSRTSGAVIGYAIGLVVQFRSLLDRRWRMAVLSFAAVGALIIVALVAGGQRLLPDTRLTNQLAVMGTDLNTVLEGQQIAYYDQEKVLGSGSASGIWRLAHWRDTFMLYARGSAAELLVGYGIGSSVAYTGTFPHNEYLRVLFEQGIIGLTLFLFTWTRIIQSAPKDVRYVGLIVAIYSFSENNLDNFPFMSLFILCLCATGARTASRRAFSTS